MRAAVVMPCLNEEPTLEATCASLGFGQSRGIAEPPEAGLILVDNGSEDSTWVVMNKIQQCSPPGSVVLARETDRGYVPPRHKGVMVARTMALSGNTPESDFLIIQADADTTYSDGYVPNMVRAWDAQQGDCIVEATCRTPPPFEAAYRGYGEHCNRADAAVCHLWASEHDDLVVDDKACAYTIANYIRWGGHRREFTSRGDEVHAETTRLYIKAHLSGARRVLADKAVAWPSRRKIFEDPMLHFATAGFPRESSWRRQWEAAIGNPVGLREFADTISGEVIWKATQIRRAHALILFGLLPAFVAELMRSPGGERPATELTSLFPMLRPLSRTEIISNTAILFERAFALIDSAWPLLARCIRT